MTAESATRTPSPADAPAKDSGPLDPQLLTGTSLYKPRGMVFDLFGDFVRPRSDGIPLRAINEFLALFGTSSSTVRVVMARLRRDGWLESERNGRETTYFLNDRSRQMLDEGRSRILDRNIGSWEGTWHLVIYSVPESERHLRDALRKELAWLGYGPLAAATWISPHDQSERARVRFTDNHEIRFDFFRCQTGSLAADRELVARCWDLESLNRQYAAWIGKYERLATAPLSTIGGAKALILRMMVTHEYRQFPFRDPRLPPELVLPDWKGEFAFELLTIIRDRLDHEANEFFDGVVRGDGR